ncbi:MAG TPA: Uma2 family endonuclease [Verrucomicrobiota bacterium]|nr:Uma2 family endonuclease [Verrucomicrobiales bacterium]HRI13974.1 Uma2 family endonuclease [Verrucomicrobiota bacterium]
MNTLANQPRKLRRTGAIVSGSFPLLDTGYHLTQPEFHRRYERMPEVKRAELIEGVVFLGSPLSNAHSNATALVSGWLFTYASETPGVWPGAKATVILDHDNEHQPDAHLLIAPDCGGQSNLSEGKYIKGPPELVVEVALSSLAHDLHEKLAVYRRNGVREYLVWSLPNSEFHWFNFESGESESLQPSRGGLLCSRFFPGLWLDRSAIAGGDLKKVAAAVRRGLASAEHTAFVKKLSAAR